MAEPKSYKAVLKEYDRHASDLKEYFKYLPDLIKRFPLDISISYAFSRLELAQNMIIYCGIVKLHRAESTITSSIIQKWHITREGFINMFETIYEKKIPPTIQKKIEEAQIIRDNIMHGKTVTDKDKRKSIVDVLSYAKDINEFVNKEARFKPFGDLRGFKGAASPLDKKTTRWILKGMGLPA